MNIKKIFHLEKLQSDFCRGQEDELVIILPSQEHNTNVTNMHPCFASKKTVYAFCVDGKGTDTFFKGLIKFPTRSGGIKQESLVDFNKSQIDTIMPFSPGPVRHLSVFNKSTIDCIISGINRHGFVCVVPKSMSISRSMVTFLLQDVKKRYKYNHLFSTFYGKVGAKANYTPIIEFFAPALCMPIYNTKRIDGIGISIKYVNTDTYYRGDYGGNSILMGLYFIFSQFRENLYSVDGTRVLNANQISSEIIGYVGSIHEALDAVEREKKMLNKNKTTKVKTTTKVTGLVLSSTSWIDMNATMSLANTTATITNTI